MADLNTKQLEKLRAIVQVSVHGEPDKPDVRHILAKPHDVKELADAGLIEGNDQIKGTFGAIAYRATVYGINRIDTEHGDDAPAAPDAPAADPPATAANDQPVLFGDPAGTPAVENVPMPTAAAAAAAAPVLTIADYELEDNVPIPAIAARKRGGARPDLYPFEKMQVGQSFFVPATVARPKPWRTMASTVNTAMARYAKPAADGSTRKNRDNKTVPVMERQRVFLLVENEKNGVKGARIFRTA